MLKVTLSSYNRLPFTLNTQSMVHSTRPMDPSKWLKRHLAAILQLPVIRGKVRSCNVAWAEVLQPDDAQPAARTFHRPMHAHHCFPQVRTVFPVYARKHPVFHPDVVVAADLDHKVCSRVCSQDQRAVAVSDDGCVSEGTSRAIHAPQLHRAQLQVVKRGKPI